ncbi:TPA: ferredoxin [Burkholderia aenigmatica]|uniref:ferredoxin n=1 Tax=Burkholderia sp. AU45251 TaxID=3059204 RepID=UPI002652D9FD|nr:ferredoxin [Burkholderia sp. AU45251]HDR9484675.1 ferredoxin [Burkholderia aenigmatica]MDN7516727.1 ferredoxin [Burkholderia sp. AU45251]HDR9515951.1 ferredoxin [Burkholderia aenigmatica]HDR9592760.1 ferredoxin [Burkholderia aenigmatica]HDR9599740.1 ferredoxin [Burkholderia aenigmatica]
MSQVTVQIQGDMCCGFGNCASRCPQVFVLDYDTNRVQLVPDAPVAAYAARIAQAARECPTQAIFFSESDDEAWKSHA